MLIQHTEVYDFLTALLRYNSYAIQVTHVYTWVVFSKFRVVQPQTILEHFYQSPTDWESLLFPPKSPPFHLSNY